MLTTEQDRTHAALMKVAAALHSARTSVDEGSWPIMETGIAVGALLASAVALTVVADVLSLRRLPGWVSALSAEDGEEDEG